MCNAILPSIRPMISSCPLVRNIPELVLTLHEDGHNNCKQSNRRWKKRSAGSLLVQLALSCLIVDNRTLFHEWLSLHSRDALTCVMQSCSTALTTTQGKPVPRRSSADIPPQSRNCEICKRPESQYSLRPLKYTQSSASLCARHTAVLEAARPSTRPRTAHYLLCRYLAASCVQQARAKCFHRASVAGMFIILLDAGDEGCSSQAGAHLSLRGISRADPLLCRHKRRPVNSKSVFAKDCILRSATGHQDKVYSVGLRICIHGDMCGVANHNL